MGVFTHFHLVYVPSKRSLRFGCANFGWCTFLFITKFLGGFMKKKITNEEVGEMFAKMAQDVRDYMDYELRVAESQMWIAENDLVDALQESQHQLYRDYAEKRNHFFKLAKEIYVRKF